VQGLNVLTVPDGLGAPQTWIKFSPKGQNGLTVPLNSPITGNHPIMNEDNWDPGDLHYQIYRGKYGFDVNGNGDYEFAWQPLSGSWHLLTVIYSCSDHRITLFVDNIWQEDYSALRQDPPPGTILADPTDPTSGVPSPVPAWAMITLDSPRLGAWHDSAGQQRFLQVPHPHPPPRRPRWWPAFGRSRKRSVLHRWGIRVWNPPLVNIPWR
jgi:hypothetical protein